MVRVKLLVRIIPEDVYLKDIESSTPQPKNLLLANERRLLQVIHEPEKMSIGVLANEIRGTFQRINQDPLGDIKYLKDGDVDADLDPEMSVYDAFVDAGKAATEVADQTATIKIIREIIGRHFRVREGSVVPDLSDPRFQPQRPPPPVPRFFDTNKNLGKRSQDDAFREEAANREQSRSPTSRRRRRLDAVDKSEAAERLVPSIERDLHPPLREATRHPQGSPVVIPETQDSPLQHGAIPRKGGSEILGEDEPKSESPEVDNSIHSLPLAQKNVNDLEILETASITQNFAPTEARNLHDIQARSGSALTHESSSRSSSNYYSPKSKSLQSISNGHASVHDSAPSSAESAGMFNGNDHTNSFARTKSNLATRAIDDGPITPPSDASRSRQSKSVHQDPSHAVSNQGDPQSRASSFSYKFRREDRANRAESEIVDTQMSPRSRKSVKRPRHSRDSDIALKMVGLREISGLFHHVDEKRPLIQDRKRQRKETKWDFSEHIDGLSVADDEDALAGEVQEEDDHCEGIVEQRSKSHALSDATNKDSNASTERQIMTTSINALDSPQAASHESATHAPAADDSDKENTNREETSHAQSSILRVHRDSTEETQEPPRPIEVSPTHKGNAMNVDKDTNSVVEILDNNATTERVPPPKMIANDVQSLPSKGSEQMNPSAGPPEQTPSKKSRSHKKKSRIENEHMTKPIIQQSVAQSAATVMTSNTSDKTGAQNLSSPPKSKSGNKADPTIEPDEQLSQDLQAPAQAGNTGTMATTKKGEASGRENVAPKRYGTTGSKSAANDASKSSKRAARLPPKSSDIKEMQHKSKDIVTNPIASDSDIEIVAMKTNIPDKPTNQKSKDGKLGLGFSQSPPGKKKGFLLPNVNKERNDNAPSLHRGKSDMSFLKKSKSFDKLMSSQSWNDETPSRSTQPEKVLDFKPRISEDVTVRKTDTIKPQENAEPPTSVQRPTKGNGRQSTSSSDEDSSTGADEEEDQSQLEIAKISSSADAPKATIEITSDSSRAESSAGLSSSKMVSKVNKARDDGPKIVPKGGNTYDVNGTTIVVPPGFTLDAYLAMRADLATQPPRLNGRTRVASSGKSATPTLNTRESSATPNPIPAKVAPKKSLTKLIGQQPNVGTKANDLSGSTSAIAATQANTKADDLPGSSNAATVLTASVKQGLNARKPKEITQSSSAVIKKAKGTDAAAKANGQAPSKLPAPVKKANGTNAAAKANAQAPSAPAKKTNGPTGPVKANAEAPSKPSAPAKEGNGTKAAPPANAQAPSQPSAPAKKTNGTKGAAKVNAEVPSKPSAPAKEGYGTKAASTANAQASSQPSAPAKKENGTKAAPTAKVQAPSRQPVPAKKDQATTVPNPPTKPNALRPMSTKKPTNLSELKARREAERAKETAAPETITPNLAKGKSFLAGRNSDSESESETESESSSSDGDVVASKGKTNARATPGKTPGTGGAKVDLSIRDPSPSSDEEESD